MIVESIIHRVSCKKGFTLILQETRSVHDSMNRPNLNLLQIFTFYYEYLIYRNYLYLGNKTVLYVKCNTMSVKRKSGTSSVNTDSRYSKHGACSGVARYQSNHQCHFWRMNSMFKVYCTDKRAWQL